MDDLKQRTESLQLGELISRPLMACIKAQKEASFSTWDFINEVGLTEGGDGRQKEAVMLSFSFLSEGKMATITVPLITIVPIPYFSIDYLDIDFRAEVKSVDKGKKVYAAYSATRDSKGTQNNEYVEESGLDVKVRAAQDDMPVGLSKVLNLLQSNIKTYNKVVDLYKAFDKAIADVLMSDEYNRYLFSEDNPRSGRFTGGGYILPVEGHLVNEYELLNVDTLNLPCYLRQLDSIDSLALLTRLYYLNLQTIDLTHFRSFDLRVINQVKHLYLSFVKRGAELDERSYLPKLNFAYLRWLELLCVSDWKDQKSQEIILSNSTRLEYLFIYRSRLSRLDISACRNLKQIFISDCVIDEIAVGRDFNDNRFNIRRLCKKWTII